jgi:hypothetical protein
MRERRCACKVSVEKNEGKGLVDTGVDEIIILKWIFKKWDGEA